MPTLCYRNEDRVINGSLTEDEQLIDRINNAAGLILGVSENRTWIEIFFEGDLMHTKTVNLPADTLFDIYVEEIPQDYGLRTPANDDLLRGFLRPRDHS